MATGARLEWLPLENIAYRGCQSSNELRLQLAPGAEAMGWELVALGLPKAGEPFDSGRYRQHLEMPGRWLERALIDAADRVLLDSPLGLAGQRVLATMWWACGEPLLPARRQALLDSARGAGRQPAAAHRRCHRAAARGGRAAPARRQRGAGAALSSCC